jgi:hypothetical protein
MTAASKVRNIPLNQLALSPTNVRKTPATAAEDAALEASIRAKGLLQNLIVHALPIDGKGVYEVDAGGRRLKILQKLVLEGVIDADHPVPCLVREPAAAVETSLMENTIRAAMHPADEFVAMAELIDAGEAVEAVALRLVFPNGMSGSACASASSRPSCSTHSAPARSASRWSPPSPSAPITRPSSKTTREDIVSQKHPSGRILP